MTPMLQVEGLQVAYGDYQVLWGLDLRVEQGEIVAILGPNGAGKSTVMNAISGLIKARSGRIVFKGERIENLPAHDRPRKGLVHVLERRHIFGELTVLENLTIGAILVPRGERRNRLDEVYALFPVLADRGKQLAGTLSGGEQQMVAIARGLMTRPVLLMLDEPMLGLSPRYQTLIRETIRKINSQGTTVLMIEQHVQDALSIAQRAYILTSGRLAVTGSSGELLASEKVREIFMGSSHLD